MIGYTDAELVTMSEDSKNDRHPPLVGSEVRALVQDLQQLRKRVQALEQAGLRARDTLREAIWSNNDKLVGLAAGAVVENFDTLIPRQKTGS